MKTYFTILDQNSKVQGSIMLDVVDSLTPRLVETVLKHYEGSEVKKELQHGTLVKESVSYVIRIPNMCSCGNEIEPNRSDLHRANLCEFCLDASQ